MGIIESLYKENNDKEFLKMAKFAFSKITKRPIDKNVHISISRLYKMYGKRGVISALITLDIAMLSGNFNLGNNYYPFLVYGAKKAFDTHSSSSENLNVIADKINKRRNV